MPRMVMPPRIGDELPLRRYRMIKSTTGAAECLARSRWVNQNRACRGQSLRCIGIRRAQAFVRQPTTQWAIVKRKSRTIGPPRHRGGMSLERRTQGVGEGGDPALKFFRGDALNFFPPPLARLSLPFVGQDFGPQKPHCRSAIKGGRAATCHSA